MGLTFNLGRISPSVFTDASNNIGIGGSPSGSYKLEVTGTIRSTGAATFSNGVAVTGTLSTNDLALSNMSLEPNIVDNTQGSWLIQEGKDDLYIINQLSGKKYKFNLTEI
jgi:hypothetical protein